MEIKNIASALVRAKKAFAPAIKNSLNPAYKSRYADLASCLDAVDGALLENGIALYQETFECESGVTIQTVLLHESGESLRFGRLHVPVNKHDAQGYGSALSYARRYSLMAACGIAAEDDDGNSAAKAKPTIAPEDKEALESCSTIADLQAVFMALPKERRAACNEIKDAVKARLSGQMNGTQPAASDSPLATSPQPSA